MPKDHKNKHGTWVALTSTALVGGCAHVPIQQEAEFNHLTPQTAPTAPTLQPPYTPKTPLRNFILQPGLKQFIWPKIAGSSEEIPQKPGRGRV